MKRLLLAAGVLLIALTGVVSAIDRDAEMIDSVSIDGAAYDDANLVMIGLWSEIALQTIHEEWAVLAGVGFGQVSPDNMGDTESWYIGAGLKFYAIETISFSLIGSYQDYGSEYDLDAVSGTFKAKMRFVSAEEVISPFVEGLMSTQFVSANAPGDDDFTQFVIAASLGCDVLLHDTLALVFKGGISQSESFDGGDHGGHVDGWTASAAMVYYWDE